MQFRQTPEGKNVFISIDSRVSAHNPLYKSLKAKSFTDGDITLHFILFDILYSPDVSMTLSQITAEVDSYLLHFSDPKTFDESTVRKKLKEYISEGLIETEKKGKTVYYRRVQDDIIPDSDVLDYFSEVLPCGVIGSFLLDKQIDHESHFAFKHHYITGALDSEILCALFSAMNEKRSVTIESYNPHKERTTESHVIPLKIMVSAQSGRQYLIAYNTRFKKITSFRVDNIISVTPSDVSDRFDDLQKTFEDMLPHMWGVSTQSRSGARLEHVEFTVRYSSDEQHIKNRLEREKRCGHVKYLDDNTSVFSADVYDSSELIPWIRTFICRITDIHFSNEELQRQFKDDIAQMYALYGLEGEKT
jgi:hypothetical protein